MFILELLSGVIGIIESNCFWGEGIGISEGDFNWCVVNGVNR